MALPLLNEDLVIIRDLPDEPNDNDGLSADELKDLFDRSGLIIQEFLNTVYTPAVEAAIDAAAMGIIEHGISTEYINDNAVTEDKLSSIEGLEAVVTRVIRDGAITYNKLSLTTQEMLTNYGTSISTLTTTSTAQSTAINSLTTLTNSLSTSVAGKQDQHGSTTVTLASGTTSWTVSASGVTTTNDVIVTYAPASFADWVDNRVRCTGQGDGTLTFAADSAPANNITVNVLTLN